MSAQAAASSAAPGTEPATHLHDLGVACLLKIFSHLSPEECVTAAAVHPLWRATLADEQLWREHCRAELGLEAPALPPSTVPVDGQAPAITFRDTYSSWRREFSDVPWPLLLRSWHAWRNIDTWLQQHAPFIAETLQGGASKATVEEAEQQLGKPLPPALRAIFRIHNGQELAFDAWIESRMHGEGQVYGPSDGSQFHGMFGGYSMYHHCCCSRMLPLSRALLWRQMFMDKPRGRQTMESQLPLAASFKVIDKLILADLSNADVAVVAAHSSTSLRGRRAAPLSEPQHPNDGALRWLEEYARRLATGSYRVTELAPELVLEDAPNTLGINLFPASRDLGMAVAVTRGVRVRVSPLLVPESYQRGDLTYAYSVGFKLLTEEEERQEAAATATTAAGAAASNMAGGNPQEVASGSSSGSGAAAAGAAAAATAASPRLTSCQLLSRHWLICGPAGDVIDEVSGEAVVGQYPLLRPGDPEFVYQSCTQVPQGERGSMKGRFRFVEGSIARPTGGEFDVVCPEFRLEEPEYIF